MARPGDVSKQLKIVEKIPFFRGLALSQAQQVLHLGQLVSYPEGHILCRDGDNSTAMFVLLAGELTVRDGDTELASISPVDIVGEMGVVTNQPRCATITVAKAATLISVGKMQFDVLLKNDVDMAARIYKNMLDSLSGKLRDNNDRLKKQQTVAGRQITASVV